MGGALGGVTGLPGLSPRLAPSHASLSSLPREEVVGWRVWGGTPQLLLGTHPRPFLQGVALGPGEWGGTLQPGLGGEGCTLPASLASSPRPPEQRRLRQPAASGELGGGGSESSRPVSLLRNLRPPHPGPWESSVLARPQRRGRTARGHMHPLTRCKRESDLRVHVCAGCVEAPGDRSGPPPPFHQWRGLPLGLPLGLRPAQDR